jgi:hypothetical protein
MVESVRLQVFALKKRGFTTSQIARKLGVSYRVVSETSMAGPAPFVRPPAGMPLAEAVPFMQRQGLTPRRVAEILGEDFAAVRPFLVSMEGV